MFYERFDSYDFEHRKRRSWRDDGDWKALFEPSQPSYDISHSFQTEAKCYSSGFRFRLEDVPELARPMVSELVDEARSNDEKPLLC